MKEFWITNITKRDVSLGDLNLTIRAYTSINLLDKHYHFTMEQIEKSLKEGGSLYAKQKMVYVRKIAPISRKMNRPILIDLYKSGPQRTKSIYEVKYEKYEELEISDEQFAEENADTAERDRAPIKPKD